MLGLPRPFLDFGDVGVMIEGIGGGGGARHLRSGGNRQLLDQSGRRGRRNVLLDRCRFRQRMVNIVHEFLETAITIT
jgi:hypothetical protein